MSITITPLPDGCVISNVVVNHNTPQFATKSLSLKQKTKERNLHQLSGSFDVHLPDERTQKRFESWLCKVRGRANAFELKLSGRFTAGSHLAQLTPKLFTETTSGVTTITLRAISGEVWEGDMFTFANDRKVYVATSDGSSSSKTISFYPPARIAHHINEPLNFDVTVTAMLNEDLQTITYEESGLIHTVTVNWTEYLE